PSKDNKNLTAKYLKNENLPVIKPAWQGNPVDEKDRFINEGFPFLSNFSDLLKWQFSSNPQAEEKENDQARLTVKDPTAFLQSNSDGILWLGHAGFFIRLNGLSIIIDAVFGKPPLVKTFVDVPSPLDIIRQLDFILVSHDHRDHADEAAIRQLTKKFPTAGILAGLRMDDLLNEWKTLSNKVQTAGWYQQFTLPPADLKIYFLPARHWSRRGLFDTNQRLWGAFVIQSASKTIYFGGDSGYDKHYQKLSALFPKIDYFIVGIGAYKPRWIMQPNHNSPAEAVQGFVDSKAGFLIPMHYGQFNLSDEPAGEPLRFLREAARAKNVSDKLKILQINESLILSN
ncbi:MAG: MBL fold metallo-hydrolase, partial [Pyrinomonadaceae bacterium]